MTWRLIPIAVFLAGCGSLPPARPDTTETIPGTAVTFEMVFIPEHNVWIGKTEVTWDEFEVYYMGPEEEEEEEEVEEEEQEVDAECRPTKFYELYETRDRGWGRGKMPAIGFSRLAGEKYCEWLSKLTGKSYRLPTEAEWETACGKHPGSLADHAWFKGNSEEKTHLTAQKKPNDRGIHDMLGNAMEYCAGGEKQVLRGGSWKDPAGGVTRTARQFVIPAWNARDPQIPQSPWWLTDGQFTGFRVARSPE